MSAEARRVFEQALALPERERATLIDILSASLLADTDANEIDPEWRAELHRRIEEVRSGQVQPESLSEVRRQIREALAR